jgi:uncharacterized protein (TIGR00369 family)
MFFGLAADSKDVTVAPHSCSPQPTAVGGPERLFRFSRIPAEGSEILGSMTTGPWLAGTDAVPRAGALGVLVDNVLGNAIIASHPEGRHAVSTEISIDVVGAIPVDGTTVRAQARTVEVDATGGLALGEVADVSGEVIAHCRQRGRFVDPRPVVSPNGGGRGVEEIAQASDLMTLIGTVASMTEDGDSLELMSAPPLANPSGNLHGGISLCVSEWLGARALGRFAGPLTTASVHIAYVRSVPIGHRVRYTTDVVHTGRTLGVAHVVGSNEAGKACTVAAVITH